jgi:uncharacterized integral membrane protein
MKWVKTFLWMVVFLFAIHFSIQNKDPVSIRYAIQNFQWFDLTRVPLFLVILCSFSLGVLIGGIGDLYGRFQLKRTLRQNQKMIERLEQEIRSLRNPGLEQPPFLKKEA